MPVVVAIALFGSLGALARYGVDRAIESRVDSLFPLSTFAINVSGCLLVSLVVRVLVDRHHVPAWLGVGLVVGFLGAYTTFSGYAYEAQGLVAEGRAGVAFTYAAGSIVAGLAAVYAGIWLARAI